MKKLLALCAALTLALLALTGCGEAINNTNSDEATLTTQPSFEIENVQGYVTLIPQAEQFPVGTASIGVTWHNGHDEEIAFGEPFTLQGYQDNAWVELEPVEDLIFILPAFALEPGDSGQQIYAIAHFYGELPPGRYRIATDYFFTADTPVYRQVEVFAEFEITAE